MEIQEVGQLYQFGHLLTLIGQIFLIKDFHYQVDLQIVLHSI